MQSHDRMPPNVMMRVSLLAAAHVIDTDLRDAARAARLPVLPEAPARPPSDDIKATDALRTVVIVPVDAKIAAMAMSARLEITI